MNDDEGFFLWISFINLGCLIISLYDLFYLGFSLIFVRFLFFILEEREGREDRG